MAKDAMSSTGAGVQASWASTRERGTLFAMRVMFVALRRCARPVMLPVVHAVTCYFFLFGRGARKASLAYLQRVERLLPQSGLTPKWSCAYRHFAAFATAILDKIDAWTGRLGYDGVSFENHAALRAIVDSGRGMLVIGSHLGNLEVCRALATLNNRVRLNVLVHTKHAASFNRILKMAGARDVELVQVTEMNPAIALDLKDRIDRGEWVVIAGDRVPVHGGRTVDVQFFGGVAPLPIGPYVLAALLGSPVLLLFCLRHLGRNHVYFEPFAERIHWRRSERDAALASLAQRYAQRLEHYLRIAPLQWFNFYPFWREETASPESSK
jgi:predicted LPLAT superfamily acyltransferase